MQGTVSCPLWVLYSEVGLWRNVPKLFLKLLPLQKVSLDFNPDINQLIKGEVKLFYQSKVFICPELGRLVDIGSLFGEFWPFDFIFGENCLLKLSLV